MVGSLKHRFGTLELKVVASCVAASQVILHHVGFTPHELHSKTTARATMLTYASVIISFFSRVFVFQISDQLINYNSEY